MVDEPHVPAETQQRADPTYNDFRHAVVWPDD